MNKHFSLRTLAALLSTAAVLQACVPLVAVGVGAGVSSSFDRRTYSEQMMDTEIEHKFNRGFSAQLEAKTSASATAFNRWVLLTGQAIDQASSAEVEAHARRLPNVREVFNEITLGYPASFSSRSNDTLLTTQVKARLVDSKYVSTNSVKVVSESGTVYLMGLLSSGEAAAASEVARSTSGVKKVVSLFEIITAEQAKKLDLLPPSSAQSKPAAQ